MKKISLLVMWLASWLVACGGQPSVVSVQPTVDPFVALESAQRTSEALQDEADFYARQLTATAEAPIVAITQTVAAFAMQQVYADATSQASMMTQTAAMTQTAQSWTATPNLTATMAVLELSATAQVMANDVEKNNLSVEQMKSTNMIRAAVPYVIGFILLFVVVMFGIVVALRLSTKPTPLQENGVPHPMINVIDGTWSTLDKSVNGTIGLNKGFVAQLPAITPERQDVVTNRAQLIDMQTRGRKFPKRLLENSKALSAGELGEPTATPIDDEDLNLPLPAWDFIYKWDGSAKPLGFGRQGLILSKATSPHILVAGTSGAGKTRFILRPLTAASLAKGEVVLNIGYSQAGFGVFEAHPNYYSMQLRDPRDVLQALAQVYDEIQRRKAMIGGADMDWEHWQGGKPPLPFLTLLVDEMENMSEEIASDYDDGSKVCKEMWSLVARITKEGRKTGVVFNSALQDGTGKSIDLRFRRNCTLVALRLGDASHSSAFIGSSGAQHLTLGRFMARTDELVIGGGFEPSDSDIISYLGRYTVPEQETPKWIEGVIKPNEHKQISASDEAGSLPVVESGQQSVVSNQPTVDKSKFDDDIIEKAEELRPVWHPKMTKTEIAKKLFKRAYAGDLVWKIGQILEYLSTTTSTTTEKSAENGGFEPVLVQ